MKCPRDDKELELVAEGMISQIFKCPECGMKITCEEDE